MAHGKKRLAVLVGCNYSRTQFELHGCINDVVAMRDLLLERLGFDSRDIVLLTDVLVPGSSFRPTGAIIKAALNSMVDKAEAGDVLFLYFSGHGTLIPSLEPCQPFRQNEAIVACDLNLITDMDLRKIISQLPKGASFTILSDSCNSGDLIDKEKEQIGPSTVKSIRSSVPYMARGIPFQTILQGLELVSTIALGAVGVPAAPAIVSGMCSLFSGIFGKDVSLKFLPKHEKDLLPPLNEDDGILLSGCQRNETSADVVASESTGGKVHGAFSNAVLRVLKDHSDALTNRELVMIARKVLMEEGFEQHPCLYCSDGNADAPFLGQP